MAFGGNNTDGAIDVATACNAHGGTGRHDFESETFIVNGNFRAGHEVTGTITGGIARPDENDAEQGRLVYASETGQGFWSVRPPTLRAENTTSKPNTMLAQGIGVRRPTPLECLRLQGFPDDWLDLEPPLADSAKYRMVGNAVAVPVLEWIGQRIVRTSP